jgi:hypothetical protein
MIFSYERISNSDGYNSKTKAEDYLENGWRRRGYALVELADIPWALKDNSLRSWNFYIHSWDMIEDILVALEETQDKKFLEAALRIANDWFDFNKTPDASSSMAWYDMAVGLRAYRLAFLYDYLRQQDDRHDMLVMLWASISEHMDYLNNEDNIVFHNNHGYFQVAGHLAMARRFQNENEMYARAYNLGLERLQRMLAQQFKPDGGHVEHSPDYHRMVVETLSGIMGSGLIDSLDVLKVAELAENSLSWFIDQSGYLANIGDSDKRMMRLNAKAASKKWRTPAMQYAASGGAVGEPPKSMVKILPETGYFIYKDWAATNDYSYLLQHMGFHSRTHKHADDLSFIWSDRGEELLVDSGRYGYAGKTQINSDLWKKGFWYDDPNRVYCESTKAHNTLEIDNASYNRKKTKPYGSALSRTISEAGVEVVESECYHGAVRRSRCLIYRPKEFLIVYDWFHDNENQAHEVKQWFNVASENTVHQKGDRFLITTPNGLSVQCVSVLSEKMDTSLHLGELGEEMIGWNSRSENEISPNYAFCFSKKDVESDAYVTHLTFSAIFESHKTVVNKSGRVMTTNWTDDNGMHTLVLHRPDNGRLIVDYIAPND